MDDCPVIHEKLMNTTLMAKSLVSLFNDYASCTGHETIVFESANKQGARVRYGIALGVLAADLNLESTSNYRYLFGENASGDRSFTFTPTFFIELPMSYKFDVCTGLNWYYTKNELHAESATSNLVHDFFLEASRVEIHTSP